MSVCSLDSCVHAGRGVSQPPSSSAEGSVSPHHCAQLSREWDSFRTSAFRTSPTSRPGPPAPRAGRRKSDAGLTPGPRVGDHFFQCEFSGFLSFCCCAECRQVWVLFHHQSRSAPPGHLPAVTVDPAAVRARGTALRDFWHSYFSSVLRRVPPRAARRCYWVSRSDVPQLFTRFRLQVRPEVPSLVCREPARPPGAAVGLFGLTRSCLFILAIFAAL